MLLLHIIISIALVLIALYTGAIAVLATWFRRLAGGRNEAWPFITVFIISVLALIFITYNPGWLVTLSTAFPAPPDPIKALT
jgi:hypothetical protein